MEDIVADFIREDHSDIYWLVNVKAFKIKGGEEYINKKQQQEDWL